MKPAIIPLQDATTIAQEFKDYAYIVSHDFSAPLRAVVEFSKLLNSEHAAQLNDEGKQYLAMIVESGEKMQQMMSGLLDYSRLNTMAKPVKKVDCNTVVQDCLLVLQDKIKKTGAKIEILPLPVLNADIDNLMQLFIILIENALKFHAAGANPFLRISAQKTEKEWEFTFRDHGIGIEPQYHERIFKPFQRLNGEKDYPGVGMGLALAHNMIDRHSGRIWVDAEVQKGTAIKFTLPLALVEE